MHQYPRWFGIMGLLLVPVSVYGNNLFMQENKWASCYYYDVDAKQVISEDCEGSKIQIASCSGDMCFFQIDLSHGNPWYSECIMWGKLMINTNTKATGTAIAEYRRKGLDKRKYEDCELEFNIEDNVLKITIKSGCDKYCIPQEFEFENVYHIDNTGGSVT